MNTRTLTPFAVALALFATACSSTIQHGLDEAEANEIQTLLIEAGYEVRKVKEKGKKPTWAIEVDEAQAASATRVLAELGLPRPRLEGFDGVETGLVATPAQERAQHLNALSEEIAATLQSVAGVTLARVHLVVPRPSRPGQAPGRAKASAFLRIRPGYGARIKDMEDELRRLVAGSVEGLQPEDVALVANEVVTRVEPPARGPSRVAKLRLLVMGLGIGVSALALGVIFLALRMRALRAKAAAAPIPTPSPAARPVVNAASARKAA